ncbi:thymidine kinase [Candidatus Dependentiae bacterium]|nr:thymidine kinase [Candidatus Dependentiae bacterium]
MQYHNQGRLEVICGSMFSGKTEELLRRLRRAEIAKKRVLTIKNHIDTRSGTTIITSHNGNLREAHPLENSPAMVNLITRMAEDADVIGIDEIQFFSTEILHALRSLVHQGKRIVVAGLDLDFRGEPFPTVASLLALADEVYKLNAICISCGENAHFSQRLINGAPASFYDPIILVGASEFYEARCRSCFVLKDNPYKAMYKPLVRTQL